MLGKQGQYSSLFMFIRTFNQPTATWTNSFPRQFYSLYFSLVQLLHTHRMCLLPIFTAFRVRVGGGGGRGGGAPGFTLVCCITLASWRIPIKIGVNPALCQVVITPNWGKGATKTIQAVVGRIAPIYSIHFLHPSLLIAALLNHFPAVVLSFVARIISCSCPCLL